MMRKKILVIIGLVAIGIGTMLLSRGALLPPDQKKAIQLANVEALVDSETDGKPCYNTVTSSPGRYVRYCPTCQIVDGTDVWYSPKKTC